LIIPSSPESRCRSHSAINVNRPGPSPLVRPAVRATLGDIEHTFLPRKASRLVVHLSSSLVHPNQLVGSRGARGGGAGGRAARLPHSRDQYPPDPHGSVRQSRRPVLSRPAARHPARRGGDGAFPSPSRLRCGRGSRSTNPKRRVTPALDLAVRPPCASSHSAPASASASADSTSESGSLFRRPDAFVMSKAEARAASLLVRRMGEQALLQAPVWSDVRSFDGRPWRGVVDCVARGDPCRPFSIAGIRVGHADPATPGPPSAGSSTEFGSAPDSSRTSPAIYCWDSRQLPTTCKLSATESRRGCSRREKPAPRTGANGS
jgi:hypothetical protein